MTCKDCIHYCICKDMWADENWTDGAPEEVKKMFSPQGCENFTAATDLVPVKHGEWRRVVETKDNCICQCSKCLYEENFIKFVNSFEYCPQCGARMDGGNKC